MSESGADAKGGRTLKGISASLRYVSDKGSDIVGHCPKAPGRTVPGREILVKSRKLSFGSFVHVLAISVNL